MTSGDSSVLVSWRPPSNPNGRIRKYTVYRREVVNGEEVEVKESSVLSGPNYLELTGLLPARRYDVWVKAATSVGYGGASIVASVILGRMGEIFFYLLRKWEQKQTLFLFTCSSNSTLPILLSQDESCQSFVPINIYKKGNRLAGEKEKKVLLSVLLLHTVRRVRPNIGIGFHSLLSLPV